MTEAPSPPPAPREASRRRELAYAVLGCLAGAGLALFAATRAWVIEETARAAPLPPVTRPRSGGELAPWLPPLALVGLAGAGALLATRGAARAVIGLVIFCCGAGMLAGAAYRVLEATSPGWPVLAGLGGVVLIAGGLVTALRGRRWPAMGARYERRPAAGQAHGPAGGSGTAGAGGGDPQYAQGPATGAVGDARTPGGAGGGGVAGGGGAGGDVAAGSAGTVQTWEALDRGEDPTAS